MHINSEGRHMLGTHPVNLALRFMLELAALTALGAWGWQQGNDLLRIPLAIGIPLLVAVVWATFRVDHDPGKAPVAIPGILRLAFELAFFSFATWALFDIHQIPLAWLLGATATLHYAISYDRILWIVKQ
jgi:hypothetical protein